MKVWKLPIILLQVQLIIASDSTIGDMQILLPDSQTKVELTGELQGGIAALGRPRAKSSMNTVSLLNNFGMLDSQPSGMTHHDDTDLTAEDTSFITSEFQARPSLVKKISLIHWLGHSKTCLYAVQSNLAVTNPLRVPKTFMIVWSVIARSIFM